MIEAGFDQPEAQSGVPIANTYSHKEVTELLSDFEIVELRQDHIFPYVIKKYVKYKYEIQPWFNAMPISMFEILKKKLGWHLLIDCRLRS